jgi:hypothetical protein
MKCTNDTESEIGMKIQLNENMLATIGKKEKLDGKIENYDHPVKH